MQQYYRVIAGDLGIYRAVLQDCPRGDKRRKDKPKEDWMTHVGDEFPECHSYWTAWGMNQYLLSGMLAWQSRVVSAPVHILTFDEPKTIKYRDALQVLALPEEPVAKKTIDDFLHAFWS
ncbi:hypothetical protein C4573_03450 [Candidatus Woesearchaeota archaeon]|nr:MAG: hypothetical protein C4573_03450 [Candidatus Woesearchaeota archaeon]